VQPAARRAQNDIIGSQESRCDQQDERHEAESHPRSARARWTPVKRVESRIEDASGMSETAQTRQPHSRDEIVAALDQARADGSAYWSSFPTDQFFAKAGEHWSPSDHVRHLVKGIRPLTKALAMPRLALRLMFGRPDRESSTYEELRARYQKLLDEGGRAGRFAPSPHEESDRNAWRDALLEQFDRTCGALRAAVLRWPDARLDRYALPHPLLGKLTVREMLFFTAYHQLHHMAAAQRRIREALNS